MLRPREIYRSVSHRISLRASLTRSASFLPFAACRRSRALFEQGAKTRFWQGWGAKTWFRAGLRVGLVFASLGLFVSAGSFPLAVLAQQAPTLKLALPGSSSDASNTGDGDADLQPLPSLSLSDTGLAAIPAAAPSEQVAQDDSEEVAAVPSETTNAPAPQDSTLTLVAQTEVNTQVLDNLREELQATRFELSKAKARVDELQALAAQAQQSAPVIAEQKARIKQLSDLTDQLKSQNTAMMTTLGQPRLSLPSDQWDYRVTFASGSARISSSQKHGLRSNLPNRPIGGCLVVVGSTDDQAVKMGGQFSSNAELSALRALRVQALIQRMDPALREASLLLGLSTFAEPGLSDDERRSVVLRWTDQDCADMISLGKPKS